jgi:hypothetical protein
MPCLDGRLAAPASIPGMRQRPSLVNRRLDCPSMSMVNLTDESKDDSLFGLVILIVDEAPGVSVDRSARVERVADKCNTGEIGKIDRVGGWQRR